MSNWLCTNVNMIVTHSFCIYRSDSQKKKIFPSDRYGDSTETRWKTRNRGDPGSVCNILTFRKLFQTPSKTLNLCVL